MEKTTSAVVRKLFGIAAPALFFFVFAQGASAASLYLSPATGSESVGQSFTVGVYVSSADQPMNAAQGAISFPPDKINVISVSTANSIINLWVQQPSFSNKDGVVNFQGVVTNPGFTGSRGKIVTITFQAKVAGSAAVRFNSGTVLANDGEGTNILAGLTPANFIITSAAVVPPSLPGPQPPAPLVIDKIPPQPFSISEVSSGDPTDPQPIFTWNATDSSSGIDKYLVKIGNGDWFDASAIKVQTSTPDLYQLPLQAPGENISLIVDAYDYAGNMAEATATFTIAPISAPQIKNYTHRILAPAQMFQIDGVAPRGARVKVYLQKPGSDNVFAFSSQADDNGDWTVSESVSASPGVWVVRAQATDERGAVSPDSNSLPVNVGDWFTSTIGFLLSWAGVIIFAIILLSLIAALVYVIHHRLAVWKVKTNKELLKIRKELREDLKRIDEELKNAEPGRNIDLSPGTLRRHQENIHREIEHIEKDLKKEIQAIDDVEKE